MISLLIILFLLVASVLCLFAGKKWGRLSAEQKENLALSQVSTLQESLTTQQKELLSLREEKANLNLSLGKLQTELALKEELYKERLQELTLHTQKAQEELKHTFSSLSATALRQSQEQFFQMASEGFKKQQATHSLELEKREQAVQTLISPLNEQLASLQKNMAELEKSRVGAYEQITQQILQVHEGQSGLKKETSKLLQALRKPTGRGRWGELHLKRVVEMAGMMEHCDFVEQDSSVNSEGKLNRPDLIVHLPGHKHIIIDAKTVFESYEQAIEEEDEDKKLALLQKHASQVRDKINDLSKKSYWADPKYNSADFVVLFLPLESLFQEALTQDPSLISYGVENHILLASPTTLITLLRACAFGWQQESLADNARKISQVGEELFDRCRTLASHFNNLGKNLNKCVDTYNSTLSSFDTRFLVSAKRLQELHVAPQKETLPEIESLSSLAREITPKD